MPLDPKQQPPYYTPGTAGTTLNKFTTINAQLNTVTTSGTTETDLYLYTIPANTLTTNGDALLIRYGGITTAVGAYQWDTRIYLDTTLVQGALQQQATQFQWQIYILRLSPTTARIAFIGTGIDGAELQQAIQDETVDWTTTIPFKITGQVSNALATIQTYYLTIEKHTQ